MPKIAVDAMGGDRAPAVVIEGVLLARQELGAEIVLVGPAEVVAAELAKHPGAPQIAIAPASQVVPMHESPSVALRKKDSSMRVAYDMMKRDGLVETIGKDNFFWSSDQAIVEAERRGCQFCA